MPSLRADRLHVMSDLSLPPDGAGARRRPRRRVGRLRLVLPAALTVVALVAVGGPRAEHAAAAPDDVTVSASATKPAVRTFQIQRTFTPPPGKLPFPVDPTSYCSVWRGSFGRVPSVSPTGKHEGTDIMAPGGNLVFAVEDGVLAKRYTGTGTAGSGFGWTVRGDSGVLYRYFHMATDDMGRVVGDRVRMGDVLGFVGDTGTTARNFHLHFEVRPNDSPVDPLPLLDIPDGCRIT